MVTLTKHTFSACFSFILFIAVSAVNAQNYKPTAQEKAQLKTLIAAVEASPDNIEAHHNYLSAISKVDPTLVPQYLTWMKKFPKSGGIPFALAEAYKSYGKDKYAQKYMLQAVALNPNLTAAWESLADMASLSGDLTLAGDYRKKALQSDSLKPVLHLQYALSYRQIDTGLYVALLNKIVARFPKTDVALSALYFLKDFSTTDAGKVKYYELLMENSINKKAAFDNYATEYFNYQLQLSCDNALAFAYKMIKPGNSNFKAKWKLAARVFENIGNFERSINEKNIAAADSLTRKIDLPDFFNYQTQLFLLRAKLNSIKGNTRAAYDSLATYYSKMPDDLIKTDLNNYGAILGYNAEKINGDIEAIWNKKAWPKADFTLTKYGDDKPVSLSDFKGKVVLLTYWFPSCGPCNAEFPHFEAVLKKFDTTKVAYLAINILPRQNIYVLPTIKQAGHTFVPLRGIPDKPVGNMPFPNGVPQNYLFDKGGRIVFADFRIYAENTRSLELMIEGLINLREAIPQQGNLPFKKDSTR